MCLPLPRARQRITGREVFDIDDRPTPFEKRQKLQYASLPGTEDPAAAVEVDQCRTPRLDVMLKPNVELNPSSSSQFNSVFGSCIGLTLIVDVS